MPKSYTPPKQEIKFTFIGPEGKAYWIGTEKGLRDMYPNALIINVK